MAITKAPITTPVFMPIILRPINRLNTINTIKIMIPTMCANLSVYVLVSSV